MIEPTENDKDNAVSAPGVSVIDETTHMTSVEDVIKSLGTGPWSNIAFAASAICFMAEVINLVGSEFTAPPIPFVCADPLYEDNTYSINGTECFVDIAMDEDVKMETVPCNFFIYDNSTFESTVTSQFDLVCERQIYQPLYQILFTIGSLVGGLVGGLFSDRFGRQKTLWWSLLGMVLATTLQLCSPILAGLLVARFLMGVLTMISASSTFTLTMEVCPPHLRMKFGLFVAVPYSVMISLVSVIAYFNRNWKTVTLLGSSPLIILLFIANPLVLSESPRWLIVRGRLVEAEKIIQRAAKLNGTTKNLPQDLSNLLSKIHSASSSSQTETLAERIKSLVSSSAIRQLVFTLIAMGFSFGVLYICVPLGADSMRSPFAYMFLLGFAEIPAYTLTVPLAARFGRRGIVATGLFIAGVLLALQALITSFQLSTDWPLVALAAIGYMLICGARQVSEIFTSELLPTSVRSIGSSISLTMSNTGFNLPPLLDFYLPVGLAWLAPLIYSAMAAGAASLVLLLPETKDVPLLETVEQYKQVYGKQKAVTKETVEVDVVMVRGSKNCNNSNEEAGNCVLETNEVHYDNTVQ